MRIKKVSQYIEGGANLSNVYGTSNENGYTQEYINNLPSAITVSLTTIQSANISTAYSGVKIAFNNIVSQAGNKLTFDSTNNCVVIGAGVHHVEVSAHITLANGSNNLSDRYLSIINRTQNKAVGQMFFQNAYAMNWNYIMTVSPSICAVNEGDAINAAVSSGLVETLSIKGGPSPRVILTVKVID